MDKLQQFFDTGLDFLLVPLQQFRDCRDVLGNGHVRKQTDLLDDITDFPPEVHFVHSADVFPEEDDVSCIFTDQAVDHF